MGKCSFAARLTHKHLYILFKVMFSEMLPVVSLSGKADGDSK